MATYKGIQGYSVQKLSSDPTAADVEGQLWYNSGTGKFKIAVAGAGAWAAGNGRNTAVQGSPGAGSQTASIAAGGNTTPGTVSANCETYDGTSWTETANLPTPIYNNSITGSTTAALMFGGASPSLTPSPTTRTTSWNGTSWSIVNSLNAANVHMAENIGIQTASLSVGGGMLPAPTAGAVNEEWDGTSWTEVGDLNTGRSTSSGCGTTTAGLVFGGSSNPPLRDFTESWNGTSWTETADLQNAREGCGSTMQGTTTATLVFGGSSPAAPPGAKALTEQWDGTSWAEVAALATARAQLGGTGTTSAGLAFGGIVAGTPTIMTNTEEWTGAPVTAKTVTVS